ncbi:MAG: hypothetical protein BWX84_01341 [Verrucomicrobia bacterium ADurb.Bin118]|nr:MAG: hypothetical protein BWX84_01341 [Verrucomicrobia bacterium ADurb.Bin118]
MKMPADLQLGIPPGHLHAVPGAGLAEHQTSGGERPFPVPAFDGEIRRLVQPQIVRGKYNFLHGKTSAG